MSKTPNWHHPVNAPTPATGYLHLVPYDPDWPAHFEAERSRIANALGTDALAIEHIGSTAVPGLCAKPIIDIMLLVADVREHGHFIPKLENAGYVLRIVEPAPEPDSPFTGTEPHVVFKGSERDLNLHVWSEDSPSVSRQRMFRDWLRTHDDDRDLYAGTKQILGNQGFGTVQAYAEAKSPVIAEIMDRAERATKESTRHQPERHGNPQDQ